MQKILKSDDSNDGRASAFYEEAVEVIREMTEALLWGEQNAGSPGGRLVARLVVVKDGEMDGGGWMVPLRMIWFRMVRW